MNFSPQFQTSSIGKKQIVATTGLLLILFVIGHLAGNLFIYGGPKAYNGYSDFLHHLRPGLYLIEYALAVIFVIHLYYTALIVMENYQARGTRYAVYKPIGERSLATRLMPYTGTIIFAFVIWHLIDFTFADPQGPRSILPNGQPAGLYGIVYNAFADPVHGFLYIVAMICLGLHLAHGIQSFFQTFGFTHPQHTLCIRRVSNFLGILITIAYSTIPIYVLLDSLKYIH